jgi:hypothetical protein
MLNDAELDRRARLRNWRDQLVLGTNDMDRAAVADALDFLYAANNLQQPNIVYCDGPLHLTASIALLGAVQGAPFWNRCTLNHRVDAGPPSELEYMSLFGGYLKPMLEKSWLGFVLRNGEPHTWGMLATSLYRTLFGDANRVVRELSPFVRGDDIAAARVLRVFEMDTGPPDTSDLQLMEVMALGLDIDRLVSSPFRGEDVFNRAPIARIPSTERWLRDMWIHKLQYYSALQDDWKREFEANLVVAQNCFMMLATEDTAYVCRKPTALHLDERGRFHNRMGPAMTFPDGLFIDALHGLPVSKEVMRLQRNLTPRIIENQRNAEVRRVMIELYGFERYVQQTGIMEHRDAYGELYRSRMARQEDIVMVRVRNSTPEPDGSYKHYFLRVPPQIRRAREGIAWTFGIPESDYAPELET